MKLKKYSVYAYAQNEKPKGKLGKYNQHVTHKLYLIQLHIWKYIPWA